MTIDPDKPSSAVISECGKYRYRLGRKLTSDPAAPIAAIIMVNPSTADADQDDATIRKLKGFGDRNGWGRIIVGNLFAYRATDVRFLSKVTDPVGSENDEHLSAMFQEADVVVFAWGPPSKQPRYHRARWRHVADMAASLGREPLSIGPVAKCGHPKHPLMLAYNNPLMPWIRP